MTRSSWKFGALVALGAFAVIAAVNWRFYFETPMLEQGDIAANALQVHEAKHGAALYGNYSRFFFYHPGPAFFYVYALGERLFRDWLGLVPSAHNAHSLAGLALQCAFFAAGLAVFADRFRSRLFVPLALFLAAAHFGLARGAFTSVWPPHVLLMPFFCFFSACVSVACGRVRHLPLAVLAGSFLVHGHVAQPLFVVTLFALAYVGLWRGALRARSTARPWRDRPLPHLAAAAVLAVFLLPLVLDWLRWPDDNLSLILHSLRGNSGDHKNLLQSVVYFLSFFCYVGDYDQFVPDHGPVGLRVLALHWGWYLGWIALFALLALSWRRLAGSLDEDGRRFLRQVVRFWGAAVLLCLAWGVIQNGPMFPFNSFFCYALLYVPLLLLAAALAANTRLLAGAASLGAAAVAAKAFTLGIPSREESGLPLLDAAQAVLRADPRPAAPKILVFAHDDWPAVASVGLVLDRSNIGFAVDPIGSGSTGLIFGRSHWLRPPYITDPLHPPSVWRFLRHAPPGAGVPFPGGLRVAFEPGRLKPDGGLIDFTENGNYQEYVLAGFSTPNGTDTAATALPEAEWEARTERADHDVLLIFAARPLVSSKIRAQPMELWINGERIATASLGRLPAPPGEPGYNPWQNAGYHVPAEVWNRSPLLRVVMKFPAARSPAQMGVANDPRVLGWEIKQVATGYIR